MGGLMCRSKEIYDLVERWHDGRNGRNEIGHAREIGKSHPGLSGPSQLLEGDMRLLAIYGWLNLTWRSSAR
jgi:hypothetical protein